MSLQPVDASFSALPVLRFRIATKLVLSIGGLLLALSIGLPLISFAAAKKSSIDALERQGDAIASTLNYAFEVLLDQSSVAHVQRIASNSALLPDVREVRVIDLEGKVIASNERGEVGRPVESPAVRAFLARGDLRSSTVHSADEIVILRPLLRGKYTSGTDNGVVGAVQIALDRRKMEADARIIALRLLGIHLGAYVVLSALMALVLRSIVARPLFQLAETARLVHAGDRSQRSRIRSRDEIGLVGDAFDKMAEEVERTVSTLEEQVASRTAALEEEVKARSAAFAEIQSAHAELQQSVEERVRLAETIKALSTPVIRIYRRVVVMPLIGGVDEERAAQIQASLLAGIERYGAREVILDLTGVPVVDAAVAALLIKAKRCAELVGAEVILVGISAGVAQRIVEAGIDLSGLVALTNLERGIVHVLAKLGLQIRSSTG